MSRLIWFSKRVIDFSSFLLIACFVGHAMTIEPGFLVENKFEILAT